MLQVNLRGHWTQGVTGQMTLTEYNSVETDTKIATWDKINQKVIKFTRIKILLTISKLCCVNTENFNSIANFLVLKRMSVIYRSIQKTIFVINY